jgi:hypothetical protein
VVPLAVFYPEFTALGGTYLTTGRFHAPKDAIGGNNLPIVELIFVTRRTFRVAEASFVVAASRFSAGGGFG